MSDSYKQKLMTKKKAGGLWETVKTVIYAVLIALVIRTFAYEPFNIPSGSMIPTLLVGDYLFVSKFSYGYSKYSLPLSLPLFSGRLLFTPPQRGDVMVFKLPSDDKVDYIKRIIGLPGDHIQVIHGALYINGQPVKEERTTDYVMDEPGGYSVHIPQYIETLPNGVRHPILKLTDEGPLNNTQEYVVPPGHYFAMGDNRDNSLDSRVPNVGYIPAENLVGRAEFLFFSTNGSAHWWEVWKWPFAIRYGRLFQAIH
ncbi:MAG TPA: signal peptidase I [Alphaproteobacteria bacterium]|nr:signal peptidase I [Alphaproteobacteria bacterium]